MSRRSRLFPSLALTLVIALGGCSFRLVRPPPPREEWPARGSGNTSEVSCTASPAPPIADLTVAAGTTTIGFLERNSGTPTVAVGLMLMAVPFVASAIYGTYHVNHCRRYKAAVVDAAAPAN